MSVLQCIEVVGRLLSTLDGPALALAAEEQCRALSASLANIKVLTKEQQHNTAIAGLRMDEAQKNKMLLLVHGKCESKTRKRTMQDYVSWPSFGTSSMWLDIAARP